VAHTRIEVGLRRQKDSNMSWRVERETGGGVFFLSSSSYILRIHVIDGVASSPRPRTVKVVMRVQGE
jgi:hypothetical protein